MPHVVVRITSPRPPAEVLADMADFSHAPEWDPSVVSATRLDTGPLRVASRFDLVVRSAGRVTPLRYEVTELDEQHATLTARTATLESIDTLSVESEGHGTVFTYDARLTLLGIWRVFNPVLAVMFRSLASRAEAGIRHRLS